MILTSGYTSKCWSVKWSSFTNELRFKYFVDSAYCEEQMHTERGVR